MDFEKSSHSGREGGWTSTEEYGLPFTQANVVTTVLDVSTIIIETNTETSLAFCLDESQQITCMFIIEEAEISVSVVDINFEGGFVFHA